VGGEQEVSFEQQLNALSLLICREYVSGEKAEALAGAIDGWKREVRFGEQTPDVFATSVTAALQEIAQDRHLVVAYVPNESVPQPPPTNVPRPKTQAHCPAGRLPFLQAMNFGIRKVELAGEVGLIACDFFPPPYAETRQHFDAAMDAVKGTRGLVIDLMNNRGGHPEMVAYALSYFFDRPPFAVTIFKGRNWPEDSTKTTRALGAEPYGEGRPLTVAISENTFSGGEEFAYALQVLGRATIVGAKSRGGANIGMNYPLPGGFRAFIPIGVPVNAVTGTNWEGVGVKPNVESVPADALALAMRIVRERHR
jgi:retinol-binding protein 3